MTDSSTSQSNSDTLLEAQPSASLLGVQKPLLTPNALGQGRDNSTSLIPLGSRRITVLDPSFFQRKPMMEEESEFSFSDSISADTPELGNTSEFLVSSSPSEKIQRSLSSKRQNQKSSPIIATSDNSSLSEVPIDPTAFDNTSSLSFQSSPHGSLQLKEELESSLKQSLELPTSASQLTSSLQAESKISIDQFINSNVKINRSSTENDQLNFSSSIERDSSSQGLSAVS